jgi:CubicO group peptidase (beta-lactamase class C family)
VRTLFVLVFSLACAAGAPAAKVAMDLAGTWEVRWDRAPSGWSPPLFTGILVLERKAGAWSGTIEFDQTEGAIRVRSVRVTGDRATVKLVDPDSKDELEMALWLREKRFVGEMRWGQSIGWTPISGRRPERLSDGKAARSLPRGDRTGIDAAAWKKLEEGAEASHTTALVVVKDGKIVAEKYRSGYDRGPLVAMSASKSIVSMAMGALIGDGKLKLETTLGELFPETRGTPKEKISVRQLLNHTSGLDPKRIKGEEKIRERALGPALAFAPGSCFQYNNNAVDFLAVVAQKASGQPLDAYLEKRLFEPLEITDASWMKDPEGVPRGAGELIIRPVDLAKLGQLMLDGGTWKGKQLLAREWIELSTAAGQEHSEDCGLLWWREGTFKRRLTPCVLEAWKRVGLDAAAVERARGLVGRTFADVAAYHAAVKEALGKDGAEKLEKLIETEIHLPFVMDTADGPVHGYSARGMLGQWLVVIPGKRLVGVRMRGGEGVDAKDPDAWSYRAFAKDLAGLFR